VANNTSHKIEEKIDESCARETLGPWLVATAVLICGAIALAFYHRDDMRAARQAGSPMHLGPSQSPMRLGQGQMQGQMQTVAARQKQPAFAFNNYFQQTTSPVVQ